MEMAAQLAASGWGLTLDSVKRTEYFEVPFEEAVELVKSRKIYLQGVCLCGPEACGPARDAGLALMLFSLFFLGPDHGAICGILGQCIRPSQGHGDHYLWCLSSQTLQGAHRDLQGPPQSRGG